MVRAVRTGRQQNGSRQAEATSADTQSPGHSAEEVGISDSGQMLMGAVLQKRYSAVTQVAADLSV